MPKDIKFIGTTSFIVSDTRVRNVQFLKEKVDIVQLLYLEEASEELEVSDLLRVKGDTEYFIHMPINLSLKTLYSWQTLNIFAEKLNILHPLNYIIHAEKAFTSYNRLFFEEYLKFSEKFPETLVENIDDVDIFQELSNIGGNICFDIGHALLCNVDIKNFITKYHNHIKAYHLHGVNNKRDHKSVRYLEKKLLKYLLDFAADNNLKIIIEVFGKKDFFDSIKFLRRFFKKYGYTYHRWD
jgi:hypothetical protein